MPTATTQERPNRRHTQPNGPDPAAERCPWCGSIISRADFQRIRDQIAEQEGARLAEVEQSLRRQFAGQQQKTTATARAEVEKAKRDAAAQIEKVRKEAAARETAIRKQAAEAAKAALAPQISAAVADATKGWHGEKPEIDGGTGSAQAENREYPYAGTHARGGKRGRFVSGNHDCISRTGQ